MSIERDDVFLPSDFRPRGVPHRYQSQLETLSVDSWFKIIEMLCHVWAVIVPEEDGSVLVVFFDDRRSVFDELVFGTYKRAEEALRFNGFEKIMERTDFHNHIGGFGPYIVRGVGDHEFCVDPRPVYSSIVRQNFASFVSGEVWKNPSWLSRANEWYQRRRSARQDELERQREEAFRIDMLELERKETILARLREQQEQIAEKVE